LCQHQLSFAEVLVVGDITVAGACMRVSDHIVGKEAKEETGDQLGSHENYINPFQEYTPNDYKDLPQSFSNYHHL
jgi:hypothetical protein